MEAGAGSTASFAVVAQAALRGGASSSCGGLEEFSSSRTGLLFGKRWGAQLGSCRRAAQEFVPVLGASRAQALAVGELALEGGCGLVAGRVGIVGAQDQGRLEGVQPSGQRGGQAGTGGDQRVGRQRGSQQEGCGKCVESALDEQQGVDGEIGGRQPEAAAGVGFLFIPAVVGGIVSDCSDVRMCGKQC